MSDNSLISITENAAARRRIQNREAQRRFRCKKASVDGDTNPDGSGTRRRKGKATLQSPSTSPADHESHLIVPPPNHIPNGTGLTSDVALVGRGPDHGNALALGFGGGSITTSPNDALFDFSSYIPDAVTTTNHGPTQLGGYSSGLTVSPNANHIFDTARLLENFGLDSGAGEITGMTQHERWESSGSSSGQNSRQETPPALNSTRHSSITGRSPSRYELSPPGLLGDGCTSKDGSRVSKTSLHIAVESGHEHIVQRLLASGRLFVDEPNGEGNTALHLATGAEDLAMCLCLLRYGANANAENAEGWTPVHLAIQAGSLEILDVLVGHNGDLAKRVPEG